MWPRELQNPDFYTRAGEIGQWGLEYWEDPLNPDVEYRRGDFYDLKDFNLQRNDVTLALARIYQYWIAISDCDGFRVDAVKHVSVEQSRLFCTAIHEYAQAIGKDNFFLTGEITEGRIAPSYVDFFGRNLDAVLGIVAYPNRLSDLVKGLDHPDSFFALYTQEALGGLYRQLGRFVVHVVDDHDMSSRAYKARFAADSRAPESDLAGCPRRGHAAHHARHPRHLLRHGTGAGRLGSLSRLRHRAAALRRGPLCARGHVRRRVWRLWHGRLSLLQPGPSDLSAHRRHRPSAQRARSHRARAAPRPSLCARHQLRRPALRPARARARSSAGARCSSTPSCSWR